LNFWKAKNYLLWRYYNLAIDFVGWVSCELVEQRNPTFTRDMLGYAVRQAHS
jgi:hypothetical protein